MKKIYSLSLLLFFCSEFISAQAIWSENFNANPCNSGCRLNNYTTTNGAWNETVTGAQGSAPNVWYVSCAENAMPAGSCGSGCNGVSPANTLHIGNQSSSPTASLFCPAGDCRAVYDAGLGFSGSGETVTSVRAESPTISLTGRSNLVLSFNYIEGGDGTSDNFTVWYYNGASWIQLADPPKTQNTCGGSHVGTWTKFSIPIPASQNNNANFKLGFQWVNNDDFIGTDPSVAIDSIVLSPAVIEHPQADFTADNINPCKGDCITFTDQSMPAQDPITTWAWTFEGGNINGTSQNTYIGQNPPPVCYPNPGSFKVSLYISDGVNQNMLLKNNFITVVNCPQVISDFKADSISICKGDCIHFTDLSTPVGGITQWAWTFLGGNPSSFVGQAPPEICYSIPGDYDVTLFVTNGVNQNTVLKQHYINVRNCLAKPRAAFSVSKNLICPDECIHFTDLSINSPTSWKWTFAGANPGISTDQHPDNICYNSSGTYDVELIAYNSSGSDTSHITAYITVDPCSGINDRIASSQLSIFPNPFSNYFTVTNKNAFREVKVVVCDVTGRKLKEFNLDGGNTFQVNAEELPAGIYSLQVISENGNPVSKRLIKQ